MLWIFSYELVKLLGCFFVLIVGWMVFTHCKATKRIRFYQAQGITAYPGFDIFFVGNAPQLRKYAKLSIELD